MKKFLAAWSLSLISMLSLSYIWHGVILNDLRNVNYPEWYFFFLLVIVYSIIAFILTLIFNYASPQKAMISKGFLGGAAFGFFIYLVAFTLGISFKSGEVKHVVVDFVWQMLEQGVGGMIVSYVYLLALRFEKAME